MSAQGLEVIDHTVQLTHEWINELAGMLGWDDHKQVLMLLRSTLTTLRDLLGHDEAAQLSAQLPILLRGIYYEGWHPSKTPIKMRSKDKFIERISDKLQDDLDYSGEADISRVLQLLETRISKGEIDDVKQGLPAHIRAIWPE